MPLTLRPTKTGLRFEYTDDDAETVVSIDKADTEADTIRKLKRVIALVKGGEGKPIESTWTPGPVAVAQAAAAATNGWAAAGMPALPDRLKGEVELIPPGEGA